MKNETQRKRKRKEKKNRTTQLARKSNGNIKERKTLLNKRGKEKAWKMTEKQGQKHDM